MTSTPKRTFGGRVALVALALALSAVTFAVPASADKCSSATVAQNCEHQCTTTPDPKTGKGVERCEICSVAVLGTCHYDANQLHLAR
ncbi:MAG TPA: hypothetical protein VM681_00560 [Candidatus Thermoplasmatota archaeon]|nr:hypothetical protein [Candidatus Thermoplasmatota archaeon]